MAQSQKDKIRDAHLGLPVPEERRARIAATLRIDGVTWVHGRAFVYLPEHPDADSNGRVKRARVVAERSIGRRLTRRDHVHHINLDPTDDDPSNLLVMGSGAHKRFHMRIRALGIEQHFRDWFSAAERELHTQAPSGGLQI